MLPTWHSTLASHSIPCLNNILFHTCVVNNNRKEKEKYSVSNSSLNKHIKKQKKIDALPLQNNVLTFKYKH